MFHHVSDRLLTVWVVSRGRSIFGVCICVETALQSDWVALDITSNRRVIFPSAVVMQPRLAVEHLPRKSQVVSKRSHACRVWISGVGTEGIGEPPPHLSIVTRTGDL